MQLSKSARRVVAGAVLALPLAVAVPGFAFAGGGHDGGGHDGGNHGGGNHSGGHGDCRDGADQTAIQGGSLADVVAGVNPATNVGGILNLAPNKQNAVTANNTNGGIQQSALGCGADQRAFQAGDLVGAVLGVSPATNVGGIASLAPNNQNAVTANNTNGGVQQSAEGGRHHGGGDADQTAVQGGSLIGITGDVSPATNIGGIANLAPNNQNAGTANNTNSGVQQAAEGDRHHGGDADQTAVQGPSLLGVDLGVNPATNVGGILNLAPNNQNAGTANNQNSGIQQAG